MMVLSLAPFALLFLIGTFPTQNEVIKKFLNIATLVVCSFIAHQFINLPSNAMLYEDAFYGPLHRFMHALFYAIVALFASYQIFGLVSFIKGKEDEGGLTFLLCSL